MSPSPKRATSGPAVPRAGPDVGRRHGVRLHPGRGGGQPRRVEERVAVGAVEEHGGAVVADGAPRLDEEMGPLRVVRLGPEPGRLGHRGAGEREVALRGGRHGPQVVAPGAGLQRRAPRRRAGGEVGRREVAAAQLEQAPAELTLVEAVAAVPGDGAQRAGDAREAHGLPDVERAPPGRARRRRGGRGRDGWPAPA